MNAPLELNERELLALAERAEAATADDEREMLWQANRLANGGASKAHFRRFCALLDLEAALDAAMMLVPSAPWPWNITMATAYGSASVIPCDDDSTGIHDPRGGHSHGAATPALALTSACLRAIAARGEGR